MDENEINLAQSNDKTEPGAETSAAAEPNYPELSIHDVDDPALMQLPDEAVHEIHGRIIHRQVHTHPVTGKKRYSARIRVHSIRPVRHAKHGEHHHKGHRVKMTTGEALQDAGFQ